MKKGLMARSEMLKRLYENPTRLNAARLSLEHWERNYRHLKSGRKLDSSNWHEETCALCEWRYIVLGYNVCRCNICPLYRIGEGCEQEGSSWRRFYDCYWSERSLLRATRRMIATLKRVVKWCEENNANKEENHADEN